MRVNGNKKQGEGEMRKAVPLISWSQRVGYIWSFWSQRGRAVWDRVTPGFPPRQLMVS